MARIALLGKTTLDKDLKAMKDKYLGKVFQIDGTLKR